MTNEDSLENPVLGYVVVTVALLVGILSASVFGGAPAVELGTEPDAVRCQVESRETLRPIVSRQWVLGVRCEATSAGCVVTSVIPGSAAERSGLSVGDRILTVDGKQVGWIRTDLKPLHHAIDQSQTGCVYLLVQKSPGASPIAFPVRLTSAAETMGH